MLTFTAGASQDGPGYGRGGLTAGVVFFTCCGALSVPVVLALWWRRRRA